MNFQFKLEIRYKQKTVFHQIWKVKNSINSMRLTQIENRNEQGVLSNELLFLIIIPKL